MMITKELIEKHSRDFKLLAERYLEYNSHTNISAIRNEEELYKKHFEDSLELKGLIEEKFNDGETKILDLGTGGGFPALPLAIVFKDNPQVKIAALDSVKKKTKFVAMIKEELNLTNLDILAGRSEDFARDESCREQFDFVLARALAKLPVLLEYAAPFLKVGGLLLAMKKADIQSERSSAEKALALLSMEIIGDYAYEDKLVLLIRKTKKTKQKYPRSAGIPSKSPL